MSFLFVEKIRKSLYKSFFNVNKKRKTRVIYKAVSGDDLLHVIFESGFCQRMQSRTYAFPGLYSQ